MQASPRTRDPCLESAVESSALAQHFDPEKFASVVMFKISPSAIGGAGKFQRNFRSVNVRDRVLVTYPAHECLSKAARQFSTWRNSAQSSSP